MAWPARPDQPPTDPPTTTDPVAPRAGHTRARALILVSTIVVGLGVALGVLLMSATAPPTAAGEHDQALIGAARRGDLDDVRRLLGEGASVAATDDGGQTALIAATWGNHLAVADALIAAGADVNVQDHTQQSSYLVTTSEGYVELLRLTLQAGADVHRTDSYNGTGLIRAADRGHVEIIETLLTTDIDVNHVNRLRWTALLEAIILGDGGARHTTCVRLLLAAGADPNLADGNSVTPLMHARRRGFADMVVLLEAAGGR